MDFIISEGNVRLSYSDLDLNGAIDPNVEILDEKNYYPGGLQHKGYNSTVRGTYHPYGFTGKEENNELDLNILDFGARNYDPALMRWMNVDPLAEYMYTHSPYSFAFNNPIYYVDPDGQMPIPLGGSDFVLEDLSIDMLMGSDFGSGGCPDGDCEDAVNEDNPIELDVVVVVATKPKKDEGSPTVWGNDHQDLGRKLGKRKGSIDINDFPMSTSGGVKTNRLMQFIRDILDMLNWYDDVPEGDKKPKPNESTMENRNEEPVDPPEPKEYYVRTYESWSDGKPAGSTTASKEKSKLKTLREAKSDSAKLMKMKPFNRLRIRDSVTIQHVDN